MGIDATGAPMNAPLVSAADTEGDTEGDAARAAAIARWAPGSRPRRVRIYRVVCLGLEWALRPVARLRGDGALPACGGLLLAPNHIGVLDPLLVGAAVVRAGRTPRFVGAAEVFRIPVVGAVLRYFDHLPLNRAAVGGSTLEAIRVALRAGECVVMYPEGKITRDARYRPGRFLRGVAQLAAETGVPVVPVGQWGAQWVLGRTHPSWLRWPPRRARVGVRFGGPVAFDPPTSTASDGVCMAGLLRERVEEMVLQLAGGHWYGDAAGLQVAAETAADGVRAGGGWL